MKKVIILGAGASIPFFDVPLTTKYLTDRMMQRSVWEELVGRYNNLIETDQRITAQIDEIIDVINHIKSINPELNFEQVIEIIDKISSYNFDPNTDRKIFHNILKFYKVIPGQRFYHAWHDTPFLFRQLIAEQILEVQKKYKVKDYNQLVNLQREFFEHATAEQGLSLVSLNYDDTVCDSIEGREFENGFLEGGFNVGEFYNAKRTISFPHGHIRFSMGSKDIKYYKNSDQANQERFSNIISPMEETRTFQDSLYCYNFNTFIVTGQSKESVFDKNPYAAYYQKFASDVATSHEIIIIGYSFGDNHFNRLLLNFLELNKSNKIIVVSLLEEPVDLKNDFMNLQSLSHKILSLVGKRSLPLKQVELKQARHSDEFLSNFRYPYQEHTEKINKLGYGMLYPQIFLYKNGYRQFLFDFKKVLRELSSNCT